MKKKGFSEWKRFNVHGKRGTWLVIESVGVVMFE